MPQIIDSTDTIVRALRGKSTKQRIAALEQVRQSPNAAEYKDEVLMVVASTMSRDVFDAAKQTLWALDPQSYVRAEKTHKFGAL